jgi:hypothetical protein
MFLLDYGADLGECFFMVLSLSDLLSIFEMLPLEAFAVFLVEYEFLLAHLKSVCDFLDQQLEWVGDIASPSCTFQIAAIFYSSFVVSEERVVHLDASYPDCHFGGEWDSTTFNFSADLLCLPHVYLFLFVNDGNSTRPFVDGIISTGVGFE